MLLGTDQFKKAIVFLRHNQIKNVFFKKLQKYKIHRINLIKAILAPFPLGRFRLSVEISLPLRVCVLIILLLEIFVLRKTPIHPAYHSQLSTFHSSFCHFFREEIRWYLKISPDSYQA